MLSFLRGKKSEESESRENVELTCDRTYVRPSQGIASRGHTYEDGPGGYNGQDILPDKDLDEIDTGRRGEISRQYAIASIANLLMLSYGIATGWPSTSLPRLMSPEETPLPDGPLSHVHGTWLAPLFAITGIPLAPVMVIVSERFGRKPLGTFTAVMHLLSHIVAAIGMWIATTVDSQVLAIVALYISRALAGFGTASGFMFTPLYCREISDNTTRGPLGVLITLIINVGTLFAYVFGGYLSFVLSSWLYTIPPALFLLAVHWLPETPVFLLRKGREEEAEKALILLRGEDYDVEKEIEEIKESLERMEATSNPGIWANIKELFSSAASRKALLIVVVLMFNKEFSGQFCITSYSTQIFEQAGTTLSSYLSSIIIGVMLVIGTIIAAFLCNMLGRRILLIISNIVMCVSLFGLGMYFYLLSVGRDVHQVGWAPVTFMSIYVVAYNVGLGPLPLVLLTELFTPKVVSTAMIFVGPIPGILAFLTGKFIYPIAVAIGLHSCFWIFSGVCVLGIFFIIFVIPETKNRPLDAIQIALMGGSKNNSKNEQDEDNEMTDVPLTSDNFNRARTPLMTDF